MKTKYDYIAVFDSGVGGLSVLRQLRQTMPGERYVYYGDSANAPYGTRPTDQVRQLTMEAAQMLNQRYPLKAMVVACNTATAAAVDLLRQTYPELIVVGIEPAIKLAADRFPGGRIGVMATCVTLREQKFNDLLHRVEGSCSIVKIPAPGLVELVESGKAHSLEARELLDELLAPYRNQLDALVLGCTHYPFAADTIAEAVGDQVCLLDGSLGTAQQTQRCLLEAGLLENGPGQTIITNSAQDPEYIRLSWQLLTAGR